MSEVAKYVGRSVDLLAYQAENVPGKQEAIQSLTGDGAHSGRITTGIQKLAQRFLLELLTERGSMIYKPARGCLFMTEAKQGQFQSQLDVFASFSAALVDIRRNLQSEESESDPDDERYQSAEILLVTFVTGSAGVQVKVHSRAGSSRTVVAPLNTMV